MSRPARPWYRTGRNEWYVQLAGRQRALGVTDPADRAGAEEAFRKLKEQLAAPPAALVGPVLLPAAPADFARPSPSPIQLLQAIARVCAAEVDPAAVAARVVILDAGGAELLAVAVPPA